MAGHIRHVSIIPNGHRIVVGCDLVDHGGIFGEGAESRQNYSCGETGVRPEEGVAFRQAWEGKGQKQNLGKL